MKLTKQDYEFFCEEIKYFLEMPEYRQIEQYPHHGKVTCLEHSVSVAYSSYFMCRQLNIKLNYKSLIRGAMLHDYYLYDWHVKDRTHRLHGFHHPFTAYRNAKKVFRLNKMERDIITTHMWPLTLFHIPKYKESIMVNVADKLCSLSEYFNVPIFKFDFS